MDIESGLRSCLNHLCYLLRRAVTGIVNTTVVTEHSSRVWWTDWRLSFATVVRGASPLTKKAAPSGR